MLLLRGRHDLKSSGRWCESSECLSARAPRGVYFLPSWEVELLAAFDWPGAVVCHSAWRWPAFAVVRDGSRMALDRLKQCNALLTRLIYSCAIWEVQLQDPCDGSVALVFSIAPRWPTSGLMLWRHQGLL